MTRSERITVAAVAVVAAVFVVSLVAGAADRLNRLGWFGAGANEIQWTSGLGLAAAIATGIAMHLSRTCSASWRCFRRGEHPVAGTLEKVCTHHHTLDHHRAVHDRHGGKHSASPRLDWGESHGRRP